METGEVRDSETLDIAGKNLRSAVEELTGFPIHLENRASAAALAELQYGAGKHHQNLIYLTSGRGIGAGIVIDGKVFRGSHGAAGELGGVTYTNRPGLPTLESRLRAETMAEHASKLLKRPLSYHDFLTMLRAGEPKIVQMVQDAAEILANEVRLAVALLDTDAVVLGGQLTELGDFFFVPFRTLLEPEEQERRFGRKLAVRTSALGEFGVAQGGAAVILEQVFQLY